MRKKTYNSLVFEELESRLLFSADIGEAFASGAIVEEYAEEPAIVVGVEEEQKTNVAAVDQSAPDDTRNEVIETSPNELANSSIDESPPYEETAPEQSPNTNSPDLELSVELSQKNVVVQPTNETIETQTNSESNDAQTCSELVLINDTVLDKQQLVDDLLKFDSPGTSYDVMILDGDEDGISQVNTILQEYENLDAIHFITHGSDGQISLGSNWINDSVLDEHSDTISAWGNALSETGDILFYGCSIAAGSDGHTLLGNISDLTGADVAASQDITGNTALGGDWDLELNLGEIDTQIPFSEASLQEWNRSLADPVLTLPTGDLSYSGGDGPVIIDSMATVTDVDSPDFDGGQLNVSFTSGGTANDRLTIRNEGNSVGNISVSGSNIRYHITSPPTIIGSFSGGTDGSTDLLILFNSNSTPEAVQKIINNITYENASPTPYTSTRTLRFALQDGDGGSTSLTTNIVVSGINNSPTITSNGGGDIANITVPENTSVVTTVIASDADADIPTFAITGGVDQTLFSISAGGVLTFNAGQDFEIPADMGTDGVYEVEVTAYDGNGGTDIQTILVTLTDVNELPILLTLSSTSVDENTDTSGGHIIGNLSTIDQDIGDTFTYTLIGGADVGNFDLNGNNLVLTDGVLDFAVKPFYEVTIQVNDIGGLSHTQTFTINVNDLNSTPVVEPSILASTISGSAPVSNTSNTADTTPFEHNGRTDTYPNTIKGIVDQITEEQMLLEDLFEENTKETNDNIQVTSTLGINKYTVDNDKPETEKEKDAEKQAKSHKATETIKTEEFTREEIESLTKDPFTEYYNNSGEHQKGIEARHTHAHINLAGREDYTRLLLRNFIDQAEGNYKIVQPAGTIFSAYDQSSSLADIEEANEAMQLGIKQMHEDMDNAFEKEEAKHKTALYMSNGALVSFTTGIASYMLRAGSLLSSLLSTVPLWKGFDPVAVLLLPKKKTRDHSQHQLKKTLQQDEDGMFG